jgi:hypothetical protein
MPNMPASRLTTRKELIFECLIEICTPITYGRLPVISLAFLNNGDLIPAVQSKSEFHHPLSHTYISYSRET